MNLIDLRKDARYKVSPQTTSDDFSDDDVDFYLNIWYKKIVAWGIAAGGEWQIAGDIIFHDLTANEPDIPLPSSLIRVYKAEVMYENGGAFVPLRFFDPKNYQSSSFGNETSVGDDVTMPTGELLGEVLTLRPTPQETVVNGVQMWVSLDLVQLMNDDDVPQLFEAVQQGLTAGAAYEHAMANEMWRKAAALKKVLMGDLSVPNDLGIKGMIDTLYQNRQDATRDGLRTSRRTRFN